MTGISRLTAVGTIGLALAAVFPLAAQGRGDKPGPATQTMDQGSGGRSGGGSYTPPPPPAPEGRVSRPADQGQATDHRGGFAGGPEGRVPRPGGPGDYRGPRSFTIIAPRALHRCLSYPDQFFWRRRHRDISAELQWMARRGLVRVHPVADDVNELTDSSEYPAGWKAYGFAVPPGEKIHIRLHHPSEGWFSLRMMNKWGQLEPGMLQNLIPTGNPEVSYKNLSSKARAVYMIVDDPGWMSSKDSVYKLVITRSWDPKVKKDTGLVPLVEGIWAVKKEEGKAEPSKAGTAPKE